ncbi:MAG: phosphoglycerate kinase [Anaerolineae bacterium]|nr:MAG: phosphoglycerate kinase [Anaerolineae bacterium]
MFNKKTIRDIDVKGKRVLVRVDFNVPLKDGKVTDDTRIRAALPTLKALLDAGAALILCSHLGRPKGAPDAAYSMAPVADILANRLSVALTFVPDLAGAKAREAAAALKPKQVLVLENTRFHPGEDKNDPELSKQLAALADIYVNDAFGSAHRAHASTVGVAAHLPAVAGLLMEKEILYLGEAIANPKRPFVAILGGAKISDKIGVIKRLLQKADAILIGGGMANTFFKAQGLPIGDSLFEPDAVETAKTLLGNKKLHLPLDVVVASAFDNDAEFRALATGPVQQGWRILDVGPETVKNYGAIVATAGTVVWNGPMGVFEMPTFATGTLGLAKAVAESPAITIVGGGDSAAAIQQSGLADKITHISTGGGASLEMLEGLELPGVAALLDKE